MDPNIEDMETHLALLFDWTQNQYPGARFEVRCIHPSGGAAPNERFDCTPDGYQQALLYALYHNDRCYNIYVTVNPLKPGTNHAADDADVEIAIYHYIDADGVDADQIADRSNGFDPTFTTATGTVPAPRAHIYWRQSEPIRDMRQWHDRQAALAQHFGTDSVVKNPARIDRLAGTVSYPPPHKQERGYVTELTTLQPTINGEVCHQSFAVSFPPVEPSREAPRQAPEPSNYPPVTEDGSGKLPLCVVEAALAAIPPIMGPDQRNHWLDIAQACRDANADSWSLFDQWQRQSDRYQKSDAKVWDTLKPPCPGSYLSLLANAKHADPRWWAHHSGEVYEWGCRQGARFDALHMMTEAESQQSEMRDGITNNSQNDQPSSQGSDERTKGEGAPAIFEEFEPLDISQIDFNNLPPRRWVYGRKLVKGYVTCFCGDGGTGKSSLANGLMLSIALGRSQFAHEGDTKDAHRVWKKGPVVYFNLEDELHEMELRVAGEIKMRGIDPSKLKGMVKLASGRDHPLCVASLDARGRPQAHDISNAVKFLKRIGAVALFVDPVVNAHLLDGNRNDYLALIIDQFRKVATEAGVAIVLIHHFRKGGVAGDVQAALGAVTLTNTCRVVETVTKMTEVEALKLGIAVERRRYYVRVDNAKANLSPPPTKCEWYEFHNVNLCNGDEDYPDGDDIGVLKRWTPPERDEMTAEQADRILTRLDQGENGFYFSSALQNPYAAQSVVMAICHGTPQQRATQIVKQWIAEGLLLVDSYKSPKTGKKVEKLLVDPAKKQALLASLTATERA